MKLKTKEELEDRMVNVPRYKSQETGVISKTILSNSTELALPHYSITIIR